MMINENSKKKWYFYEAKDFPAVTQAVLRENGFQCKRRLWYRIVEDNILQMVYLRCLGRDRMITFSSDPLFAPLFTNAESKKWFAAGGMIPSFRTFHANTIDYALNHFPYYDVRMRYVTKDEAIAAQFDQIIHMQVCSIVLHYLNQMRSIESNLTISSELVGLTRGALDGSASKPVPVIEADDVTLRELLYLGRYQLCVERIDAEREKDLKPLRYRLEQGLYITPKDIEEAEERCRWLLKWKDEMRTAAVSKDVEWIRSELEGTFTRNKEIIISQLGIGRDLEFIPLPKFSA